MSGHVSSDVGRYAIVPEWVLDDPNLSDAAVRLYAVLACKHADRHGSDYEVTRADLAAECHKSSRGPIDRAKQELVDAKALAVTPQKAKNGQRLPDLVRVHFSEQGGHEKVTTPCSDFVAPTTTQSIKQSKEGVGKEKRTPSSLKTESLRGSKGDEELSSARQVFDHWQRVMQKPRAKFTGDRKSKIDARLGEGFTVEELCQAVDGCAASDFHMGRDPMNDVTAGGKRYDSIGLIFRNGEKTEEFAGMSLNAPKGNRHTLEQLHELRKSYHPEVEVPDMREAGEYPFDPESEKRIAEAGL